ncbi:hypothetical protein A4E84_11985 [Streptomyces qaidamensis]|uniref:Uncharacterized protein n=1 Tax=Streptomyces qaidamensis TaxID=1783515 RepID=A0A143BZ05_9ACTN|nr:hypothetical protein [Streptomyces qaidamensis]AMW10170.1 hypothetical protein A4E84_11985 [Streptomyces qaidamensis]
MAHTFAELVEKQRAADEAYARVRQLQDAYGPPTQTKWSDQQTTTWETAWRAWRDLARDVQAAVTGYAKQEGTPRPEVEARVKEAVRRGGGGGNGT